MIEIMPDDKDINNPEDENNDQEHNPELDDFLSNLINKVPENNEPISPSNRELPVLKVPDTNQSMQDVIDKLTEEEIRRMQKNLYFLDFLEEELRNQVVEMMQNNSMNVILLQKIIDTMNKSVDRSNRIIKDRNSELVQILIDNRTQNNINQQVNIGSEETNKLPQRSRKKLTKMLSALLEEPSEDIQEEQIIDAEIISDEDITNEDT
jgi:hypothetical protein